jgi:hypothetical protein
MEKMEHILLVEPAYYSKFPPIGLMKISSYEKGKGNTTELIRCREGLKQAYEEPSRIYVTSLFTYAWRPVHEAIKFYKTMYPEAEVILGGIYASLLPKHALGSDCDKVHEGLFFPAEDLMPDYGLIPEWNASVLFTSRGCIRHCPFCAVPIMEPEYTCRNTIKNLLWPNHEKIILWDNNFLASKHWESILSELREANLIVDFNQGLDARLLNEDKAEEISKLKLSVIRMAYDRVEQRDKLEEAIELLSEKGVRKRNILVYTLYNFRDTPDEFFERINDLLSWGVVAYPMRFQPIRTLRKDSFVSSEWTAEQLEMIADARRVLGTHGAFPPSEGLLNKFSSASGFKSAFSLRNPV